MGMSDKIEAFIIELLRQENEDWLKIQRNELAELFGCVPSQINYVISTRFGPDKGYIVESRRGGGGCVRIKKAESGRRMTADGAREFINKLLTGGRLTAREAAILQMLITDEMLGKDADDIRARMISKLRGYLQ
ncbi:MAG: CtsR family transcriptional regulator [Clostridia bacterium]|nr:CtsR family transcriptional regulator [Clostridia bacterium]